MNGTETPATLTKSAFAEYLGLKPSYISALVKAGRLVRVCPQYRLTSSNGRDPQMHAVYPAGELPTRVRDLLAALRRAGLAY